MNKNILFWLDRELPRWVAKGWITTHNADNIRDLYSNVSSQKAPSMLRLIIVGLGFGLLALGVFLVFAGYWYSFSPNGRFDWMVALVIFALFLVALALGKASKPSLVSEGVAIFYFLAMALACWLIGDTYYLGNSNGLYILITAVLTLPIAYLLRSALAMGCYLLLSSLWGMSEYALHFYGGPHLVWILLLLAVPFYGITLQYKQNWNQAKIFLSWAYILALYIDFFTTFSTTEGNLTIILLANLAVVTFSLGRLGHRTGFWTLPFRSIGFLGVLYVIFRGTLMSTWQHIAEVPRFNYIDITLVILTLGLTAYFAYQLLRKKYYIGSLVSLLGFILGGCALLACMGVNPLVITVIFNIYILLMAVFYAVRGTLFNQVNLINAALVGVLCMVLARFFDPGFTFLERGISFIIVGIVMLVANVLYYYRRQNQVKAYNHQARQAKRNLRKGKKKTIKKRTIQASEPLEHEKKNNEDCHNTANEEKEPVLDNPVKESSEQTQNLKIAEINHTSFVENSINDVYNEQEKSKSVLEDFPQFYIGYNDKKETKEATSFAELAEQEKLVQLEEEAHKLKRTMSLQEAIREGEARNEK